MRNRSLKIDWRLSQRSILNRAFTLIELLVVIAIIAILAALLFPLFSHAKQKGQGIYCLNNGQQMIKALHMYAGDFNDWLPPNPDYDSVNVWVQGNMTKPAEATNTQFLTDPQYAKLAPYTGPSPSLYKCPGDTSTVTIDGRKYPRVRTFSMSQAVGTKPTSPPVAVDGPWLNGTHHHKANNPWRTYGRFGDMIAPSPSSLWIFIDENEFSINDAGFGVSMETPTTWEDWPGTYHNFGCGLAFADGHSESHKWTDGRTKVVGGTTGARDRKLRVQPNNADIVWLQQRTLASVQTDEH